MSFWPAHREWCGRITTGAPGQRRIALLADAHTLAVLLQTVDFTWFRMESVLHEHMIIGIAFVGVPFALELPQAREMLAESRTL